MVALNNLFVPMPFFVMQKTILRNRHLSQLFYAIRQIYLPIIDYCRSYIRTVHAVHCAAYRHRTCSLFIVQRIWENYAIAADKCIVFFSSFPVKHRCVSQPYYLKYLFLFANSHKKQGPTKCTKKKNSGQGFVWDFVLNQADIEMV